MYTYLYIYVYEYCNMYSAKLVCVVFRESKKTGFPTSVGISKTTCTLSKTTVTHEHTRFQK